MNLTNICCLCTLESPVDSKVIKLVNPKGDQNWIFIGKTDAKAEATIFWSHDVKSRLIGKDPDAGKDWRQREKEVAEDEMVRLHHWLNGHEFEQTLGDSEGQGSLAGCSPWGPKDWATEQQWQQCTLSRSHALSQEHILMETAWPHKAYSPEQGTGVTRSLQSHDKGSWSPDGKRVVSERETPEHVI